jgi:putative flippase GtrA
MRLPRSIREIDVAPHLAEVAIFIVVGVAATACQYVGSLAAQRWLGLGPILASLAGYALGVCVSYFGNSRFTFRRPALHGPQFVRFATISLTGLAINLTIVWAATHLLGWPLWVALVPVVLLVPAATFMMSKFWAFRVPAAEPAA